MGNLKESNKISEIYRDIAKGGNVSVKRDILLENVESLGYVPDQVVNIRACQEMFQVSIKDGEIRSITTPWSKSKDPLSISLKSVNKLFFTEGKSLATAIMLSTINNSKKLHAVDPESIQAGKLTYSSIKQMYGNHSQVQFTVACNESVYHCILLDGTIIRTWSLRGDCSVDLAKSNVLFKEGKSLFLSIHESIC